MRADEAILRQGNPRRKIEGFGADAALHGYMKSLDPLECDLSKLATANWRGSNFDNFRFGVWREIRHRQAVESLAPPLSLWRWSFLEFGAGRLGVAAACVAVVVGVGLGLLASPSVTKSRVAARNLDLGVFSHSASGLPSNLLASRK
jgi:hypothetical protein